MTFVPDVQAPVSGTVSAKWHKGSGGPSGDEVQNLVAIAFGAKGDGGDATTGASPTVRAGTHGASRANGGVMPAIAFEVQGWGADGTKAGVAPSVRASAHGGILPGAQTVVRRLTPLECERLQGLPDGWTAIPWRGKAAPDSQRYRAIGNGWAVPVARWIMARLDRVAARARAGERSIGQ